ncbi:MAG: serine racemase VanT catalytic subunit [Anaerorhabdus sp.]|uniref:serine racemase VanT catalytic subunit n=1 Tax=Anaerorhabdus sp. TaxID=1872524 RepID=UPI002FCACFBB
MYNLDREYGGFDVFKFFASILVITVHVGPLLQINSQLNFLLTGILARIAVPFFMMVTGFFVLAPALNKGSTSKIRTSIQKEMKLYVLAILIYLPLNIYANQLPALNPLAIFKFLLMDGTFYHLWYFPSMIIGLIITSLLCKKFSAKMVLYISFILFGIGLFGDSYFGFIINNDVIKGIYDIGFIFYEYTRNGIFYAPVFLMLGAILHSRKTINKQNYSLLFFVISLFLMIFEGIYLEINQMTRHNSMYLFLIPTMIFLFDYLRNLKMKNHIYLRKMSTWIYILHPFIIVIIRGIAKVLNMSSILVHNNLVLFILCTVCSILVSYVIVKCSSNDNQRNKKTRSWIEISESALNHNINVLKQKLPSGCKLMPVLKADGYGHGAIQIAKILSKQKIKMFCVATIDEGIELRRAFIQGDILILGYTPLERINEIKKYRLTQTLVDYQYAYSINQMNKNIKVHIAIDTGMHRLGIPSNEINRIIEVLKMKKIGIKGIFTHLCCADGLDEQSKEFTCLQIDRFKECVNKIGKTLGKVPNQHIQSSYGLINYSFDQVDYARIGIALYGAIECQQMKLKPVLFLKSRITTIKRLQQGEGAGYGQMFKANHSMKIAIVAIGYADGLSRLLSCEKGNVIIHDQVVPIIGRICMDQCMIDITNVNDVQVDDEVILIGSSESCQITVTDVANESNTIPNETLVQLKSRLPRILVN